MMLDASISPSSSQLMILGDAIMMMVLFHMTAGDGQLKLQSDPHSFTTSILCFQKIFYFYTMLKITFHLQLL